MSPKPRQGHRSEGEEYGNDEKDGDFSVSGSDGDDDAYYPNEEDDFGNGRRKSSLAKQQNRARTAMQTRPGRRKSYDQADEDSDSNGSGGSGGQVYNMAYDRERRLSRTVSRDDDATFEELAELEIDEDAPTKSVEKLIGFKEDEQTFYVRFMGVAYADSIYMTRNQIAEYPSGSAHLRTWDNDTAEYGLIPHPSIPFLEVPGNFELPEDREIDRIVAFDDSTGLYLVKWAGEQYEDATFESEIQDKEQIEKFMKRNEIRRALPEPHLPKQPYGTGEGCTPLPAYKNENELRDYQIDALNWMRAGYCTNQNLILADEMGLGKTIMCITMILDIVERVGVPGPFLIVAPLSTLPNWLREFDNWSDLNVILLRGRQSSRELIKKYEIFYPPPYETLTKAQVVLTNQETVVKEIDLISSIKWHFVIIDEAHRLKNINSKLYNLMFPLQMEHVLLMTGTPIQNNIDEIYALLHFIAPDHFTDLESFKERFHNAETAEDITALQQAIQPYMLRRKKTDVETSIGAKEETIIEVELTRSQKFYYRILIDQKLQTNELVSHSTSVRFQALQNLAMQLRKVCNHPFLLPNAEQDLVQPGENINDVLIQASGKMVFVDKLLAKLKPTGTKVLIFSQMVKVLNLLEDFLNYRGYSYVRLDGRINGNERQQSIDEFNNPESGIFVFLLCTRAGGVGLNLTAANTVIIYDSDWNPQNDIQAQSRCHRIGQSKDVQVYRLITRGTYESEMFDRASKKLGLDQAILDSNPNSANQLSHKEIEDLIKRGAYHVLLDDDSENDKFASEDIDEILEHRSKVMSKTQGGDSVFKRGFIINNDNSEQVDVNDAHFWERMMPLAMNRAVEEQKETTRRPNMRALRMEIQDQDAIRWNASKRDHCFNVFMQYGWGRWQDIAFAMKPPLPIDAVEDVCNVFLHVVADNYEAPDSLYEALDRPELTNNQRRMMISEPFAQKSWVSQIQAKAEMHAQRIIYLRSLHNWISNETPIDRFTHALPKLWTTDTDARLLRACYAHGWNSIKKSFDDESIWGDCPELEKVKSRQGAILIKRVTSILTLMSTNIGTQPIECHDLIRLKGSDLRELVSCVSEVGELPDMVSQLSGYANIETMMPIIINTARIIIILEPRSPMAIIKSEVGAYCNDAGPLVPIMTPVIATRLRDNVDWLTRLRNQAKRADFEVEKLSCPAPADLTWWDASKHGAMLIRHVCEKGFARMSELLHNYGTYDDDDIADFQSIEDRKHKSGNIRRSVGLDIGFFFDEQQIKNYINDQVDQLGGWKVPLLVDIPDTATKKIELPYTEGAIVIESFGSGETLCYKGYLYRPGFRARTHIGPRKYICKIVSRNGFIVMRGDKQERDTSPAGCFARFGEEVAGDMITEFGLSSHVAQYEYAHTTTSLPASYEEVEFVPFTKGVRAKMIKDAMLIQQRGRGRGRGRQPKRGRPRTRFDSDDESEDDLLDDDDDMDDMVSGEE